MRDIDQTLFAVGLADQPCLCSADVSDQIYVSLAPKAASVPQTKVYRKL